MLLNRLWLWKSYVTALVFLCASAWLGHYYFTYSPQHKELMAGVKVHFFKALRWSWLKPDIQSMRTQILSGKFDEFDRVTLTSALSRWRVQSFAYHSFEKLTGNFRCGLWDDSFVDDLTALFNEMDSKWIQARQVALNSEVRIVPEMHTSPDLGFNLRYPAKTTSAQVGSLLEILFTVKPGSTPADFIDVYWETAADPLPAQGRINIATVEDTSQTTDGLPIYRTTLDMSQSPQWLEPTAEPVYVNFRGTAPVHWTPIEYNSADSPQLPIPADSKPYDLP